MKILLHGATDFGSSNFGDFIYGEIYHSFLKEIFPEATISYYNPSDYFKKYTRDYDFAQNDSKNADALVYIPGGYFGEGNEAKFKHNLIQFVRFMPAGLKAIVKKQDIYVSGVGAGPNTDFLLTNTIKAICKKAELVTVRDAESKVALEKLGVSSVIEGADPILAFDYSKIIENTTQVGRLIEDANGKRTVFIHFNHSSEALEKFAKAINIISRNNKDLHFIVGSDQLFSDEDEKFERFKELSGCNASHYKYDSSFELLSLLNRVDTVLTCKLHVGVIATIFNKSVICIAEHPTKSKRYYKRIGTPERCVSLYETSAEEIVEVFNKHFESPVNVPSEEIAKAQIHYDMLKEKMLQNVK
ncbi:polysaccharide pyruvyl transferase family protein [Streptococcus porcinus]|uniref:Polysaccharide pyruvyl transferase CsaB n=1 Tax=Streptococcus porcinus TaxID=1340 RepID=A0A4V0H9E1_STRPO|nr:polysaccharide pyruvyl transferase family protein [Streptococcus porcinus]VTT43233.1 polysaccharide pyruvyl transferase CsaB [Streptococcus porcinus]VTT44728.1 polysaccharide pyruvyl transferase CsaB [Streptococcus porcinus]